MKTCVSTVVIHRNHHDFHANSRGNLDRIIAIIMIFMQTLEAILVELLLQSRHPQYLRPPIDAQYSLKF